jgi:peroxiredoxin
MPDSTTTTEPRPAGPRRRLPVGPFGLLVLTAIALLGAFAVTKLMVDAASDDPVDIQDALDSQVVAPIVSDGTPTAEIGSPAPNVRLEFLDGSTTQLAEIAGTGTPVVLNFWSSTCAPCLQEMPALEQVSKGLGGKVTVVGIDSQDTVESGQKMVDQTGVTYDNARDPKGEISTVFGALSLPRTVLIAADGTVADVHTGALDEAGFTELLSRNGFPTP